MKTTLNIKQMSEWVKNNWDKIPDNFKSNIKPNNNSEHIDGLKLEGHIVVLLVDRQKPSVTPNYDFAEERIGINFLGEIIWGFDSGCSCPSPWDDNYPYCYSVAKTWKEFKVDGFDIGFLDEAIEKFLEIKSKVENENL